MLGEDQDGFRLPPKVLVGSPLSCGRRSMKMDNSLTSPGVFSDVFLRLADFVWFVVCRDALRCSWRPVMVRVMLGKMCWARCVGQDVFSTLSDCIFLVLVI